VRQVSPVVDAGTLTGTIYVDLPASGPLRAGMFVAGEIQFSDTPALHVPESTLVYRDGYQYVMQVDAGRRVHQLKVTTGRRQGDEVEITVGLSAGIELVASGGSFLNEGDTVRVAATPPAAAAEPAAGGNRS
jgi:multidrug efflux pump subunit AcrA (membrane-fusion protein)